MFEKCNKKESSRATFVRESLLYSITAFVVTHSYHYKNSYCSLYAQLLRTIKFDHFLLNKVFVFSTVETLKLSVSLTSYVAI